MKNYCRLLAYLRPHLPGAMCVVVLSLVSVAAQGAAIWIAADFLQSFVSGSAGALAPQGRMIVLRPLDDLAQAVLSRPTPFGTIVAAAAALLIARLAIGALQVLRFVIIAGISQSILATIRNGLFDRLTRLDLSFSRNARAGEVASVFLKDVDQLNEAFFDLLERSVLQSARLAAVIVIMLSQSWVLMLWLAVFLGAGAIAVRISGGAIERLCSSTLRHIATLQGSLVEYLSCAILARLLNREDFERRRFAEINNRIRQGLLRIVFLRNLAPELVALLFGMAAAGILVLGGYQVFVLRTLSAGALLKLIMLSAVAAVSIERLAAMYATFRVSMASARRVFDLLEAPPPAPDPPDAIEPPVFSRQIDFHEVEFSVDGHVLLQSVNLRIRKGQRVLIFGPSGAGKSTLLGLLAGVLRCSRGRIEVDGIDLGRIRTDSWRRKLGVVLQDAILLNATVRDNLRYACPEATDERLERALAKVRLGFDPRAGTSWLDRRVGANGENLSGGECQRIAIARALLADPEILLLDEPTSMLDPVSKQQVLETILVAGEGRTLVLVTHDPFLRALADVEIQLREGRVVEIRDATGSCGANAACAAPSHGPE